MPTRLELEIESLCWQTGPKRPRINAVRTLIGVAMRLYRRSSFYPRAGQRLARFLSWVPVRKAPVVREIDGVLFELDLREVIDASLYYSGTFEAKAERVITSCLAPGMVALDVGANFGYHTFRMAKAVGPSGSVLAIEPTSWGLRKLRRNLGLNRGFSNVDLVQVGISDRDQGLTEIAFQSSYRLDSTRSEVKELVRLISLDTLVTERGLSRVDFIKVDVDGFEGKFFRGARETLRRFRPNIVFEISPSYIQVGS